MDLVDLLGTDLLEGLRKEICGGRIISVAVAATYCGVSMTTINVDDGEKLHTWRKTGDAPARLISTRPLEDPLEKNWHPAYVGP